MAVFAGIWLASLMTILSIAFTTSRWTKIIWTFLIGLSTFSGDLYFRIVQERLTYETLEVMFDGAKWFWNADEGINLIHLYGPLITKSLAMTIILCFGIVAKPQLRNRLAGSPLYRKGQSGATRTVLIWNALKLLPFVPHFLLIGLIYYVAGGGGNETKGMPTQFYTSSLATVFALSSTRTPHKSEVKISAMRPPAIRHVVLIVDESIRGDFIDLNHNRRTTPYLLALDSLIVNFGLAISGSNCTNASNAIMRLGANPKTLGKSEEALLGNPSIWKYAKKAGYETIYLEAQWFYQGYDNYMNKEEIGLIDRYISIEREVERAQKDRAAARLLRELLQRPTPQFIYVNKQGAHFPYEGAYPREQAAFFPHMEITESISSQPRLINSYKNAIRWSVDGFFEKLVPEIDLQNVLIIYTADHGQNLLDDGQPVTHCRRLSPSLFEAVVPLFIVTGNRTLYHKFQQAARTHFNQSSHFQIFPTLLTLFGYETKSVQEIYYQSLFAPMTESIGFVTGSITGHLGRRPEWHSRAGLDSLMPKSKSPRLQASHFKFCNSKILQARKNDKD
jgi:hypothetical protein